jgi:hypothetical protein
MYCFYCKVDELVLCITLIVYEIQLNVFREDFTKLFGYVATVNNTSIYNLGISEVRKLYLHIDEVFGKAATNKE